MKISFNSSKETKPTEHEGMNVIYGAGRRAAFKLRWYLLLALVASPLLILAGKVALSWALIEAPGKLVLPTSELYSPQAGVISKLFIKPGDEVAQGEVIAQLEDLDLEYRIQTLRSLAERNLSSEQKDARQQAIAILAAEVKRANDWYSTTRKMKAAGVLTQMEEAQASQGLLNARSNLLRQQIEGADLARASDDIDIQRNSELSYLIKRMDRLQITASTSGKVIDVPLKEGQALAAGDMLARVSSSMPALAQIYLNPNDLYRASPGTQVSVLLPGGKALAGVITKNPSLAVRMPTELKEAFSENQMGVLVNVEIQDSLDDIELIDQLPVKARFASAFGLIQ